MAIFLGILLMIGWGSRYLLPHNYEYHEPTARNGVKLHTLVVDPERIELRAASRCRWFLRQTSSPSRIAPATSPKAASA